MARRLQEQRRRLLMMVMLGGILAGADPEWVDPASGAAALQSLT
jgi:hypothetical protein